MREIGKKKRKTRQIFEVTEVLSTDGVFMMLAEVRVCVLWTKLEFEADQARCTASGAPASSIMENAKPGWTSTFKNFYSESCLF